MKCHAKYWLILDFMRATTFQKVGTGSNKRPEKLNVHIRNSWRTNLQLIRSIGNMIGYKKSLSEWQCLSEVKMGRGITNSPNAAAKNSGAISEGVSQRKIAKSLKLSSSTLHNIIQRFRESGTISVRKGQGRKTILDARDLRALDGTASHTGNATVMESHMGSGILPENIVGEHNPPCHSPLPAKNSIGQKEAISKHDPEVQAFSLWARLI